MAGTIATYPTLYYEVAFNTSGFSQGSLPPYFVDVTARTKFRQSFQRGRQYELDTNPAGTWRGGLEQKDGALDPSNTASPYAPNVIPYRQVRVRAQTAPTRNLFPQVVATGSASMNPASDTVAAHWYSTGSGTLTQVNYLAAAPSGQSTALGWGTPAGTTSSSAVLYAGVNAGSPTGPAQDCVQVAAGSAYTASVYASRASSADATVQVTLTINWFASSGAALGATVGSGVTVPVASAWVRATVTATAPTGAVWGRVSAAITSPASTTAVNTLYLTGWQFEQASGVSGWADPGPTYFLYTGMVERWPQTWQFNGTYGYVNAIGVDALAGLAQYTLAAPFVEEVLAYSPNFFYQLNDPAGSTSCADSAGKRIAAPVENSPYGAGSLVFGSQVTSSNPGSAFVGTPGPVATCNNTITIGTAQAPQTYISLHKTTPAPGPPAGNWTRIIAFRTTTTPGSGMGANIWTGFPPTWYGGNLSSWWILINDAGKLNINCENASGLGLGYTSAGAYTDGNWHQVVVCAGSSLTFYVDGVQVATATNPGSPTGLVTDVVGAAVTPGINSYANGFVGDVAFATELGTALTGTQVATVYGSWRSASSGESSGARAQRILTWVGYKGAAVIDTGQTRQMGPATDLTGATALDALNAVALTENGNVYAASNGAVTFAARTRRYNQTTPVFVFGENTSNGEWPYESISLDFDPTHLFNDVQVTHHSSGQVATATDAASQATYFPRILQRTINPLLYTEAVDASDYLLQQYKSARMRVADLQLHPSAIPGLFTACLQLEIGTRIRVMRRPPSAPGAQPIQIDCFVESITWDLDPETGDAVVHLQCSPADLAGYWVLAALHTTVHTAVTSGTNTATLNALPDSAVNAFAQSVPAGYQLVFDPGRATQETMTIAPGGIPATTPGYSTVTLTFTSTFTSNHSAGAVVCEPLPGAYTDPTTWDAASVLAAASTTLAAASASGTNTITVDALGDAQTNALASDYTTGDLIWIGPGAASFEGLNRLHPDIATAGEGAFPLAVGMASNTLGINTGYTTLAVASSATAYQGSQVWSESLGGAVASGNPLFNLFRTPVAPGLAFTWSAYTRSGTSGANPQVYPFIQYLDANGAGLAQANGATVTLTGSPTASWTRISVTATAPAGAVWASLQIILTGTTPAGAWVWQCDGLQVEQASSASTYQTCPQVLSVAAGVPGYSTCVITLARGLANSHAAGETVCDPLPPGGTSPAQVAASTRIAY